MILMYTACMEAMMKDQVKALYIASALVKCEDKEGQTSIDNWMDD